MRSIHNMNFEYTELNVTEKLIVDYIDRNAQTITSLSIADLASELHVNKASIVTLCKKLGFDGYKSMKDYVANAGSSYTSPGSNQLMNIINICNSVDHTHVLELFSDINKIICIARGNSYHVAEIFANIASYNNFEVLNSNSIGRIDSEIYKYEDKRLIIVFSHSGNTQSIIKTCRIAQNRGIKILLITGNPNGKVNDYCDTILNYNTYLQTDDKYDLSTRVEMMLVINSLLDIILNKQY